MLVLKWQALRVMSLRTMLVTLILKALALLHLFSYFVPARLEVRRMDSWWSEETSLCSEANFTVDAQLALQSQAAFHLSRSSQDVHTVILLCMIRLVLCMLFQI